MTTDKDSAPDAAALLAVLSGMPGVAPDAIRQAQKAMADAMGAGTAHQAFLEQQWAITQATADAVRGENDALGAAGTSLATSQQLAQARACFNVAVEAVRALSEAASVGGDASMDQVVRRFHAELAQIHSDYSNK